MQVRDKRSSIESWDEIWGSYDRKRYEYQIALEENKIRWQRIRDCVLRKFGSFHGLKCIEIGAGSGHYSMLFAREGAHVTLLDYSQKALAFCKNVFREQCIPGHQVHFIHMNALDLKPELVGKFALSMSFGVAEHFTGGDRKTIIESHLRILEDGGLAFISVPNKSCLPLRIHQFLKRFVKQDAIEAYPFTKRDFINIVKEFNVKEYFFIGSSIYETYNPLAFLRRKRAILRDISLIKKEKGTFLDQYMGRELTLVVQLRKVQV